MPTPFPWTNTKSHLLLHKGEILGMLCPDAPMGCITNQGCGYLALIPSCPPSPGSHHLQGTARKTLFLLLLLNASPQTRAWQLAVITQQGSILWSSPKHKHPLPGMSLLQSVPPVLGNTATLGPFKATFPSHCTCDNRADVNTAGKTHQDPSF